MFSKKNVKKPVAESTLTELPGAEPLPSAGQTPSAGLPGKAPTFNDLEAEFLGTYHAAKALRMAYTREIIIGGFAVLFAVLYFAFPRTEIHTRYFATEPNGTIMPMVPFNQPFDSNSTIISWTEQAVTGVFSFDTVNYRRRMESAKKYFTPNGFVAFLKYFKGNGLYTDMKTRKLMVSAVQNGVAVIRKHGQSANGVFFWQVQVPVHLRLENSNGLSDKKYIADVVVRRVSNEQNPAAIAIRSISLIKE